MSLSQGAPAECGNTKQLPAPRWSTMTRGSCPDSQTTSGQCCVPRAAQDLVWHCLPFPPVLLRLSLSPFSQSLAPAGVAVSSTLLATTAQRAGAGVLGRRGHVLESVGVRICREAGAPVSTNVFVCDLDLLAPNVQDARRLEIVAEGLPLHGGAQLAVDTTLVSAHHCDGTARPGAAHIDGAALVVARCRKERAYPELVGPRSRAKMVVLAGEVGGRWSEETATLLRLLAAARGRSGSALLRRRAEQAWRMRWRGMLACAAARAFAASLLEQRSNVGGDADPPLISDVLSEFRHNGLG